MRRGHKAALLGGLAVGAGVTARRWWLIRMPLREFTRYALYMAVLDDEICRNELEGCRIGDEVIRFPPRAETLQDRYQMFLQLNPEKEPPSAPGGDCRNGGAASGDPAVYRETR